MLIALAVYASALVLAKSTGWFDRVPANDPAAWNGAVCAVTGVVSSPPDPRPTGCVYTVQAETVEPFDGEFSRHSAQGLLLAHVLKSTAPAASPGDRVRFIGKLQPPKAGLTPGAFDYQAYLANHNIRTLVYASSRTFENLGASGDCRAARFGWRIKQHVVAAFERRLTKEQAAVLSGLVAGSRPRFFPEIKRIFVESGTMHVLVASGSNVAFVVGLFILIGHALRLPFPAALIAAVPGLWIYVFVAGADAPIIRAGIMGTVGIGAFLLNRDDSPLHALGLSALLILILNPRALFDVGFQMSFLSVLGLIAYMPTVEEKISGRPFWVKWPARLLAASLSAQIWLWPVTAGTFQRFFPIGILSNIIVVPLSGLGLSAGVCVGIADLIPTAGHPLLFVARGYLALLITLVRLFADKLGTSVWVSPPTVIVTVGFYLVVATIRWARGSVLCRLAVILGLALIAMDTARVFHARHKPKALTLTWIDTGRRLSTLIESADGKRILINPGPLEPADTTERVLMPFLVRRGIRSLDMVLITDPEPARTAAVSSLIKWVDVSTVVYANAALAWISDGENCFLFADRLTGRAQKYLATNSIPNLRGIQTHFPRNWIWKEDFLALYKPKILVESFSVSDYRPSVPPWAGVRLLIPQKSGWASWIAPSLHETGSPSP